MSPREVDEENLLAALMGISEMIGGLADLDELLETIVRIAPRLATVSRCAIFLRDERAREFRVAYAFSPDEASPALLRQLTIHEEEVPRLTHKLVDQKIPVMFRQAREPLFPEKFARALNIRSMLLVPLAFQGTVLGFMALDEPGKDHVFTSQQVNVMNSIAAHTAIALVLAKLEEAVRREQRRFEAVADAASDGVVTLDAELRITSLSPGAEALLGWPRGEVAGRPCGEVLGEELAGIVRKLLTGARRQTAPAELRAKDAHPVPCVVTAVALPSPAGKGGPAEVVCAMTRVESLDPTTRRRERTEGD